jgi:toxin ParE1/3/4
MAVYRLTEAAEADIVDILAWSEVQFGAAARVRYERLVVTALIDVAVDPLRPGSRARPELGLDVRTWHLRGSRDRVKGLYGLVQRPRHFLLYRPADAALIVIGRVLHDAMEPERHLQESGLWD